jgi:hypothetical protein
MGEVNAGIADHEGDMAYIDYALHLSFPREVKSIEHKVLYTLWREGAQCIANLGLLTGTDLSELSGAVLSLAENGQVDVANQPVGPFTMCSLNKKFIKSLSRR